jgi:hypothetical protein
LKALSAVLRWLTTSKIALALLFIVLIALGHLSSKAEKQGLSWGMGKYSSMPAARMKTPIVLKGLKKI